MKHDTQINTLTCDDVERMSYPSENPCLSISLYLGIRADRDFLSVANSLFSEEGKRIGASKGFSHETKEAVEAVFSDMEKKLRVMKLPDRTRTFILFFNDKETLKIYKVPVYIPPRLVVERNLYIHPFIKNLQKYPRYCVVFLARDRAKIFNYFWGEVEDETPEIRSDVPQRMNAARADWKGLSENRILKHIDVHVDWHLKKVADEVDTYMRKHKIPRLIIGSHRELFERFKDYLPTAIRQQIVGSYLIRTDQSLEMIREKSLEAIGDFEMEKENGIVQDLIEGNSKKEKEAVLGIEPALEALQGYKVRTLIIGKDYVRRGYVCPNDHHVCTMKEKCLGCGVNVETAGDIADEMIEAAMKQGVGIVHFLDEHPDFDRHGVGAFLR